jgi:DNA polymerase V
LGERHDEEQQSYTSTRSFAKATHDKLTLMSALGHHVAHVAEKLRRDGCSASKLSIIARGSRHGAFVHRVGSAHISLSVPTNDTITLTQEVSKLLDTIYDAEIPYKKAGVFVNGIEQVQYQSVSLFEPAGSEKDSQKLGTVFDTVNEKFGSGTLRTGVTLGAEKWKSERKLLSQEYTTKWSEIACVKAI